jgi:hypothetical protein
MMCQLHMRVLGATSTNDIHLDVNDS